MALMLLIHAVLFVSCYIYMLAVLSILIVYTYDTSICITSTLFAMLVDAVQVV
jgi:hypothetical protein